METITLVSGTSRPGNYTKKVLSLVEKEFSLRGKRVVLWDAEGKKLGFPGESETDDAKNLQSLVRSSTALVLASPEYHGSFSAMTKLILENMGFPSAIKGKPIALLGVAQGRIGAIKSLEQLRSVCSHMGALVLPATVSIAGVQNVVSESGEVSDEATLAAIRLVCDSLLEFVKSYVCPKIELESLVRSGHVEGWTTVV